MSNWLRLVRWKNLVIVFLTQMLVWYCVVILAEQNSGPSFSSKSISIILLALSTVFIAAAGYAINDYFDIRIDTINKPGKTVLEKSIPRRKAIILHVVLNIAGLILAALIAISEHHPSWILLQLVCIALLWFYSTHFKRQFVTGNIVVSLLTALTIITVFVYNPSLYPYVSANALISNGEKTMLNPIWLLGAYTFFAFMLTWMREVVKDMEDHKGDMADGCKTMPVVWGLDLSAKFAQVLGYATTIPLIIAATGLFAGHWIILGAYTIFALVLPIILWCLALRKKQDTIHYHTASTRLKIIMLLGIGSLIIYYLKAHA